MEEVQRAGTELDGTVAKLAADFAQGVAALSTSPIMRAALLPAVMAEFVIALEDEFDDCHDVILDALESQAAILKGEIAEKERR